MTLKMPSLEIIYYHIDFFYYFIEDDLPSFHIRDK